MFSTKLTNFIFFVGILFFYSQFLLSNAELGCPEGLYLGEGQAVKYVNVKISLTADNTFAIYTGNEVQCYSFIGSGSLSGVSTFEFLVPNYQYLYVICQSDLAGYQGMIANFFNLNDNITILSQSPEWQVSATGRYGSAPYSASQTAMKELDSQILASNKGLTPSKGWVQPVAGPVNGQQWGYQGGILAGTQWIWHSANGDPDPTSPGFNHNEYLIFRLRVEAGLPKTCLPCTIGNYCPQNSIAPTACPPDTWSNYIGAKSSNECTPLPKYRYWNLNSPVFNNATGLFEITNLSLSPSMIYLKVNCDEVFEKNNGPCLSYQQPWRVVSYLERCSSAPTERQQITYFTFNDLNKLNSFTYNGCILTKIASEITIKSIFAQLGDESISETCVMASSIKEVHGRFYVDQNNTKLVRNCLTFQQSSEGVLIEYAANISSRGGVAELDMFSDTNPFTRIFLTDFNDTLHVANLLVTQTGEIPTFYLGAQNDIVVCESDCIIYGQSGNDTFSVKNTKVTMEIRDFDNSSDIIDLKVHFSNIKIEEHINFTYEGTTLILMLSDISIIKINTTQKLQIFDIKFVFDAPSCYRVCNSCLDEQQCLNCIDCKVCDGSQCTACNSTTLLERGRCKKECSKDFLHHTDPTINHCIYCTQPQCLGCTSDNYCTSCKANFIPKAGMCEACPKGQYSNDGDQQCKPCGLGCDICNSTTCLKCSMDYLFAPRLSTQICYKNPAVGSSQVAATTFKSTSSQSSLFSGQLISKDGSIINLDSVIETDEGSKFLSSTQIRSLIDDNDEDVTSTQTSSSNLRMLQTSAPLTYKMYKQYDTKWGSDILGTSASTIKQKGCFLTSVAMVLATCSKQISGQLVTPKNLNKWLKENNGYANGNNLAWGSTNSLGLVFVEKQKSIDSLISSFKAGKAVILAVKQGGHKVLMTSYDESNGVLFVNDPGFKTISYKKSDVAWGYVYKLPSGCATSTLPKTSSSTSAAAAEPFNKDIFGFQSCYKYTNQYQSSLYNQDYQQLIQENISTLNGLDLVKMFINLVQIVIRRDPIACYQKDSRWRDDDIDYFGVFSDSVGQYETQTYSEGGSQLCSLSMLLSSLGIKDSSSRYYTPDILNKVLIDNGLYKKQVYTSANGLQTFYFKNKIDWQKLSALRLFGLSSIQELKQPNDGISLTSGQVQSLKQQLRNRNNMFILELKDGASAFATNRVTNNNIIINDPQLGQMRYCDFSEITNYVQFTITNQYYSNPTEIAAFYTYIAGLPYYHAILTYESTSLKQGEAGLKRNYYLLSWQRNSYTSITQEKFTVINTQSKQQIEIGAILDVDGVTFILTGAQIYVNKKYLVDKTAFTKDQPCSREEVMNYIGFNPKLHQNSQEQNVYCFDNSITSTSDLDNKCPFQSESNERICEETYCKQIFGYRYNQQEAGLKSYQGIPKDDSRYCALMKMTYQYSFEEVRQNSKLMQSLKDNYYSKAAFAIINTKQACLAAPRQLMELYLGINSNLSPKTTQASEVIQSSSVDFKIKACEEIVNLVYDQSQGLCAKIVRKAIQKARNENDSESGIVSAKNFGPWLEKRGYQKAPDLEYSKAKTGDIVIFEGTPNHRHGHIAIKCSNGKWYSDFKQRGFYPYADGTKPPYLIYN